jgi:three-Cys-motif partner protein
MTTDHRFGGDWTAAKLEVLRGYLGAYATVLKRTAFHKVYIDAFAGTGYRAPRPGTQGHASSLFPDLAEVEPQKLLDGSARIALQCEPRFDRYVFIEQDPERCSALRALASEFPDRAADVEIREGEANEETRALCGQDWRSSRAVLFLDPYGMQVEWATIAAVAATRAIDLWLLFPLGIGVNRLLTRSGDIPAPWQQKLDSLLGTSGWRDAFYRVEQTPSLFGNHEEERVKATSDTIGRFFLDRLRSVFPGVAREPGVLKNSRNCPLYLLCFAAANERGAPIALRIAEHLLRDLR